MDTFLHRFGSLIKGCISGFDRIVFKGYLRPIMFAAGMQQLLATRGVLNKHYKAWVERQSDALVEAAETYAQAQCGHGGIYLPSCNQRKDALVERQQRALGISQGLIGVWACVEACTTFRSTYDRQAGVPQLRTTPARCKHLYFYYDHADLGLMSIRLQTWAPYGIQIALNGRAWLRRALEKEQCAYLAQGNKFWHIADYGLAQRLLDGQLDTRWAPLLSGFLPLVFPTLSQVLGDEADYYWTLWQSEWATDYLFASPQLVPPLMEKLVRHALLTGTGERVLRYLGQPIRKDGQPHASTQPELVSKLQVWYDGMRIRHWVDHNSVKCYNEQNVIRVEMTMNQPEKFRVYRHAEGETGAESKQRRPLRKGIADIPLRAQLAADVNHRFTEQLATLKDETPVGEVLREVVCPGAAARRPVRALDITGKDRELLQAIADPIYAVSGLTHKALQQQLGDRAWAKGMSGKRLSARISRNLRLLRDHGLIRKVPNQRRYHLTAKGRKITTAVNVIWAASTEQLLENAA